MYLQPVGTLMNRVISRSFHFSKALWGTDGTEKRLGHIKKKDKLEGEYGAIGATHSAYELIDENLMERVIGSMKFKDIPIVYIKCTRNNTKITLSNKEGRVDVIKSAGTEGYKHCRKGTTVAAQAVANRVLTHIRDHDINTIRLVFNGLGPGRGAAYKVFELSGINVVSLSDRTEDIEPWHNRPRAAKSI